ncbi:hypothetical protein [Sporosarcina limicola]|uniref:Uncharacterized protein n=1 Tax=Sporosarcina limicola TaxID=34101 RepID=A0A927RE16_9BACL|nr:hypothetical protein [Sporosarcina limicola]MBE1554177.1 hypothetical protein [Sporosarcina limicola]
MKHGLVFGGLLFSATIFGVFAQWFAYFLNDNFWAVSPVYYVDILTILSIVMFVTAFIYAKKASNQLLKMEISLYCIILLLGIPTTLWSVFVCAMWQG